MFRKNDPNFPDVFFSGEVPIGTPITKFGKHVDGYRAVDMPYVPVQVERIADMGERTKALFTEGLKDKSWV